jgi:hypothetical protein
MVVHMPPDLVRDASLGRFCQAMEIPKVTFWLKRILYESETESGGCSHFLNKAEVEFTCSR